jgi:hypothetical protein
MRCLPLNKLELMPMANAPRPRSNPPDAKARPPPRLNGLLAIIWSIVGGLKPPRFMIIWWDVKVLRKIAEFLWSVGWLVARLQELFFDPPRHSVVQPLFAFKLPLHFSLVTPFPYQNGFVQMSRRDKSLLLCSQKKCLRKVYSRRSRNCWF